MKAILLLLLFIYNLQSGNCQNNSITITPQSYNGTDAYSTFQNALDKLKKTGGVLKISPGTYVLSKNIIIGSNTSIIGSGIDVTTLKLMDYAKPWKNGGDSAAGFLRALLASNIYISNLSLDGNKQKQKDDANSEYGRYGIYTGACKNVTCDRVRITNFQGYGFDPHGEKGSKKWGKGLVIKNCIADNNGIDGFTLDMSYDIIATNNTAINNSRHGFNIVTGSRNILLENNKATGNGFTFNMGPGCGIKIQNNMFYGTGDAIVRNNELVNSKRGGICLDDVFNITVTNNVIADTNKCMDIYKLDGGNIYNNTCVRTSNNSIDIQSSINTNSTNNTFSKTYPPNWDVNTPVITPTPSPTPIIPPSPSPPIYPSPSPVSPSPDLILPSPSPPPINNSSNTKTINALLYLSSGMLSLLSIFYIVA
jgi:parallel beta-helix repeat protein